MGESIKADDFEFVAKLVKAEAAITLEKGKEYLVESRLEPVARSLGYEGISAFVDQLKRTQCKTLSRTLVESLTTHETSFFRDIEPFEVLKNSIIPKILEAQRAVKELTIWCGAASSGQEPYSLCILLRENFPELQNWRLKIFATDISSAILSKARSGIYTQMEVNRGLPVKLLVKYFEKEGQHWKIKPEVCKMIEYSEQNLLHPYTRIPSADLVMLRNVLIYFDIETKKQILAKIRGVMKPSGYLMLGAAETTINIDENFERIAYDRTSCYKKK